MNYRIVFMGSPGFALPSLQKLAEHYQVVGVITQPDRPAGRGRELKPPAVKKLAEKLSLPVIQPKHLREIEAMQQLRTWKPDLIVVAAFGQILRPEVLDLPPHGCLNVHASLLPRWRGAAPIPAAILHGDTQTGVTIMRMNHGVDTGPILSQRVVLISPEDTTGTLTERLAEIGANLLIKILPDYLIGRITLQPQDDTEATYAPFVKKEDGRLDFNLSAEHLARRVRAFNPWPSAYTFYHGKRLLVHKAHPDKIDLDESLQPGRTRIYAKLPAIETTYGLLILDEVQPAGKKSMPGQIFLQGARDWNNGILLG